MEFSFKENGLRDYTKPAHYPNDRVFALTMGDKLICNRFFRAFCEGDWLPCKQPEKLAIIPNEGEIVFFTEIFGRAVSFLTTIEGGVYVIAVDNSKVLP
jgi:hypothetical protein